MPPTTPGWEGLRRRYRRRWAEAGWASATQLPEQLCLAQGGGGREKTIWRWGEGRGGGIAWRGGAGVLGMCGGAL